MDGNSVFIALTNACSQDPNVLKPAEEKLKILETQPGFYKLLLLIYTNHEVSPNVRWLAVVCLKNGVEKYWRKSAPNALSDEEKLEIKDQLLISFNEPESKIAVQLAVLISKVARLEAKTWPELLQALSQGLQSSDMRYRSRSLLIFQHVVKMLASKKLLSDKEIFRELASNTFNFMLSMWNDYMRHYSTLIQKQNQSSFEIQEACLLSTKILKSFMVHGFKKYEENSSHLEFIRTCLGVARQLLSLRLEMLTCNQTAVDMMEKLIASLIKMILSVHEYHAIYCVSLLEDILQFCAFYVFSNRGSDLIFEKFTVHCCNLMSNIVKCESYKLPNSMTGAIDEVILQAHKIQKSFFTQEIVNEIVKALVSHYFLLTQEDIALWDSDPEEFENEEVGESWRYQLRPSTEKLLLILFKEFRPLVTPVIVNIISSVRGLPDTEDFSILLQKEAVYKVAGLCSYDLFEEIDFEKWLTQDLLKELQNKSVNYKIIRRRVIWLIGNWINVKLSPPYRPMVYEIILDLLKETDDLVVRLNASRTLQYAVGDFEFRTQEYLPFLEDSVALLFKLLCDVKECDTKMRVLFSMSTLVERVGQQIKPYVSSLAGYLPKLWVESEDHNMLRCSILVTLSFIVKGLGADSIHLYPFLTPVIQLSTDVTQPAHVYLLEDGLLLWSHVLRNAPIMTPELLHLFNNIPHLLELSSENLRTSFSIVESYVLLGRMEFLQVWGHLLVDTCSNHLGNYRPEGNMILAKIIETVFRMFPADGPNIFEPILQKIFFAIIDGQEYGPLLAVYVSLFSIVILNSREYLDAFIQSISRQTGKPVDELLGGFIDSWLERMDSITTHERRKLTVMAFCSFLLMKREVILNRLAVILEVTLDVLKEFSRDPYSSDAFVVNSDDEDYGEDHDTQEHRRRKQLNAKDPVYSVKLPIFVRNCLQQCQQLFGEEIFHAHMSTVESSVVNELQSFVNIQS